MKLIKLSDTSYKIQPTGFSSAMVTVSDKGIGWSASPSDVSFAHAEFFHHAIDLAIQKYLEIRREKK